MEAPKYYTEFVPHAERINLDKPVFHRLVSHPSTDEEVELARLAAEDVTHQLIGYGTPSYYNNPEFRIEGGRKHAILIEIQILQGMMRDNWHKKSKYGELGYIHGLRLAHALIPQIDITPSTADYFYLSMGAFGHRVKGLHLIGAQNMGKSFSGKIASLCFQAIFRNKHYLITSTPTKSGAKDTAFGDIKELFNYICEAHPHEDPNIGTAGTWVFPFADVSQQDHIYFQKEKGQKGGWFENRALKKKIKGAKGAESDTRVGIQEVDIDEVNEVENVSKFTENLSNMKGNPQFFLRTSQNPEQETDSGGWLCEPSPWGDWGYSSFDEVREQDPMIWPTKQGEIVYRMDGHRSINIMLGKTIYTYLFNEFEHREPLERKNGQNSHVYQSQARAMFSGEGTANTLLSASELSASKWTEEFFTIAKTFSMSMGVDPAHAEKGDKAVISTLMWADCIVRQPDDSQVRQRILIAKEPLKWVRNANNFTWDPRGIDKGGIEKNDWWDKFVAVGGDINSLTVGAPVSYEFQIAIEMASIQKRLGIPKGNIWYDMSMRDGMVTAVRAVMGYEPTGIDSSSPVRGHKLQATDQSTADRARSASQENILLMADVLKNKKLRVMDELGAQSGYGKAFRQLCKRRANLNLKGSPPESKKDFMSHNGNQSPDEQDAVALAIGAAYSAGFRTVTDTKPTLKARVKQMIPQKPKPKLFF